MSPKHIVTVALVMIALTGQIAFAAEPPANVQNVTATVADGKLTVAWAPVTGAISYTIYYSHQSILENGGDYDDFEPVAGGATSFTFDKIPLSSPMIFVAVLASDAAGAESEGFETEASVTVAATSQSSSMSVVSSSAASSVQSSAVSSLGAMPEGENPTTTSDPMAILSVQAVTETGVLVTFTKPVRLDAVITPEFFIITDSGAMILPIKRVTVSADSILIDTAMQVPAREYTFGLLQAIPAGDGTNVTPSAPQVKFIALGSAPVAPPPTPVVSSSSSSQTQSSIPSYGQNPILGSVTPPTSKPTQTPESGAGLLGLMAAAGAISGWRRGSLRVSRKGGR